MGLSRNRLSKIAYSMTKIGHGIGLSQKNSYRLNLDCQIRYHQYADDTQLYTEIDPRVGICSDDLTGCVESVTHWFLLNANKTEAIVLGTWQQQQLLTVQQYSSIQICGTNVRVSPCIKTLNVHLDATLSMDVQVSETVKVCNFHICSSSSSRAKMPHIGFGENDCMRTCCCQTRLLQLSSIWYFKKQHNEATACPERPSSC